MENNDIILCDNSFMHVNERMIQGNGNYIKGDLNVVVGYGNIVVGQYNQVNGDYCRVYGRHCRVTGHNCFVEGTDNIHVQTPQPKKTSRSDSPITRAWRPLTPENRSSSGSSGSPMANINGSGCSSPAIILSRDGTPNMPHFTGTFGAGRVKTPKSYKEDQHSAVAHPNPIRPTRLAKSGTSSPTIRSEEQTNQTPSYTDIEKLLKGLRLKHPPNRIDEEY